jgi:hypothetical protein
MEIQQQEEARQKAIQKAQRQEKAEERKAQALERKRILEEEKQRKLQEKEEQQQQKELNRQIREDLKRQKQERAQQAKQARQNTSKTTQKKKADPVPASTSLPEGLVPPENLQLPSKKTSKPRGRPKTLPDRTRGLSKLSLAVETVQEVEVEFRESGRPKQNSQRPQRYSN